MLQNGKTKIELSVERMSRTPNAQENGIELVELVVRRRTREVPVLQALQSDRFLFDFVLFRFLRANVKLCDHNRSRCHSL